VAEIEAVTLEQVRRQLGGLPAVGMFADRVAAGELDPYRAADELLRTLRAAEPVTGGA
jgi:LAO/AO transport system kinase